MVKLMDKPKTARPAPLPKPALAAQKSDEAEWPAEGPHARADLINEAATPGSGLFSSKGTRDGKKVDPGAG